MTPVESLAQNGLIEDAITSYKLSRLSDGKNDGEITFTRGLSDDGLLCDTMVRDAETGAVLYIWLRTSPTLEHFVC